MNENEKTKIVYDVVASNSGRDGSAPVVLIRGSETRPVIVGHRVRVTRYLPPDDPDGFIAQDGYLDVTQYEFVSINTRRVPIEEPPCQAPPESPSESSRPNPAKCPPRPVSLSELVAALFGPQKPDDSSRAR